MVVFDQSFEVCAVVIIEASYESSIIDEDELLTVQNVWCIGFRAIFFICLLKNGVGFGDLFSGSGEKEPRCSCLESRTVFLEHTWGIVFRINAYGDQSLLWESDLECISSFVRAQGKHPDSG